MHSGLKTLKLYVSKSIIIDGKTTRGRKYCFKKTTEVKKLVTLKLLKEKYFFRYFSLELVTGAIKNKIWAMQKRS